jgi:PAS domain S-box-containing protein
VTSSRNPSGVDALRERFRAAVRDLAGAMPLSVASLAARAVAGGPLETLLTLGFDEEPGLELAPLVIGDAAAQWFEANHRELVLDVRPDHVRSEFYRPFTRYSLRSVIVLPMFRGDELLGTLAVGSRERDAYTKRHLRMMMLLAAELAPEFPAPAPAPIAAAEMGTVPTSVPMSGTVPVFKTVGTVPDSGTVPLSGTVPSDEATVEADALGRVREWNGVAERLFGISRDEAVGKVLAVFYREGSRRRLSPRLAVELTARGRFVGRALGFDAEGRAVTCDVELTSVRTPAGATGFRGRFRRVESDKLLPREDIRFDFARLYAFANPV